MGSGFHGSLPNRCARGCDCSVQVVLNLSIQSTEANRRDGMPFPFLKLGGLGYID